jgi:hypothetical protein
MIWFTHFEGNKNTLLYHFFLANYKVLFGFYRNLRLEDRFPLHTIGGKWLFLQDIVAPFYLFIKSSYLLNYVKSAGDMTKPEMFLKSEVQVSGPFRTGLRYSYEMKFEDDHLNKFHINGNQKISGEWVRVQDF